MSTAELPVYPRILEAESRELARIEALRAEFGDDPEFADEAIDWGWSVGQAKEEREVRKGKRETRVRDSRLTDTGSQHGVGREGQAGRRCASDARAAALMTPG